VADASSSSWESRDDPKSLAPKHHVWREDTLAAEIAPVRLSPIFKGSITLALIKGERVIHLIEASGVQFESLKHGSGLAEPVEHNHFLPDIGLLTIADRPARRGLYARQYEAGEFLRKRGIIAKRKGFEQRPLGGFHNYLTTAA
jgi:hypothetical protein